MRPVTVPPSVELSVCNASAAACTVTDSVAVPTARTRFTVAVSVTSTVTDGTSAVSKPLALNRTR